MRSFVKRDGELTSELLERWRAALGLRDKLHNTIGIESSETDD